MKKFISITAIALVVVCLFGVLAACSSTKGLSIKKAKVKIDHVAPIVATGENVSKVTGLSGTVTESTSPNGVLVWTTKQGAENTTLNTLYNLETNTILAENTPDTFHLYSRQDNSYYLRHKKDATTGKYLTTLYNAKGEEVKFINASGEEQSAYLSEEKPVVTNVSADIVAFADNYFRVKANGNSVERIGRQSALVNFDYNFTDFNDNYYYQIETNRGRALIFDKKLNLVTTYYAHGDYTDLRMFVLKSGDLLVQTTSELMDEAKEYTYIANGKKVLMKTYVVNAANGNVSESEFKYYVAFLAAMKEGLGISIKADNVALLYAIEDERLLNNVNDGMAVSLSDKLKIKGRIDQMIDNQTPGSFPDTVNNYLLLQTTLGKKLVSTGGKVIGDYDADDNNESLFILNDKLYTFDLKMVFDLEAEGFDFAYFMNNSVILTKTVEGNLKYYRFDWSLSAPKLLSEEGATFYSMNANKYFYAVKTTGEGGDVYTYYNEKGEVLSSLPTGALLQRVASNNDKQCCLYSADVSEGGSTVKTYYRIGK